MAKASTPKTEPKTKKKAEGPTLVGENTRFTLTIPADQANKAYQKALAEAQKVVKIDGFRQGKVPLSLVEQRVGRNALVQEASERVLSDLYRDYIIEHKLMPLTEPAVLLKDAPENGDWTFEVEIAVRPEITLGDYKKIVTTLKSKHEAWKEPKKSESKDGEPASTVNPRDQQLGAIMEALLEKQTFAVPELLLRRETERQLHRLADQLQRLRLSVEEYLSKRQITIEDLQTEVAARALGELRVELLLSEIIRETGLETTDEEIESFFHPKTEGEEQHHHDHEHDPETVQMVRAMLLKQKAFDHLLQL